jgi:hypothetical protein
MLIKHPAWFCFALKQARQKHRGGWSTTQGHKPLAGLGPQAEQMVREVLYHWAQGCLIKARSVFPSRGKQAGLVRETNRLNHGAGCRRALREELKTGLHPAGAAKTTANGVRLLELLSAQILSRSEV